METLEPKRTLNGRFDAYCHVCWCPVYAIWVSDEDPAGKCMEGQATATKCSQAMVRARLMADVRKAIKESVSNV